MVNRPSDIRRVHRNHYNAPTNIATVRGQSVTEGWTDRDDKRTRIGEERFKGVGESGFSVEFQRSDLVEDENDVVTATFTDSVRFDMPFNRSERIKREQVRTDPFGQCRLGKRFRCGGEVVRRRYRGIRSFNDEGKAMASTIRQKLDIDTDSSVEPVEYGVGDGAGEGGTERSGKVDRCGRFSTPAFPGKDDRSIRNCARLADSYPLTVRRGYSSLM